MAPALVSVILPTYNRCDTVASAIDSVLAQTYPNVEVIVIDDGSTDGTQDMLHERYQQAPRVHYLWQENAERALARNRGIKEANGEFLAFIDSDDSWAPDKLASQMPLFEQDHNVALVHSGVRVVSADGRLIQNYIRPKEDGITCGNIFDALAYMNRIICLTAVVSAAAVDEIGGFNTDRRLITYEDWELWLRVAYRGQVGYVPEALGTYRIHADSESRQPFNARAYRCICDSLCQFVRPDDRIRLVNAARRRYRLAGAEAWHGKDLRRRVSTYAWALRATGPGFAWEDAKAMIWRLCGGRARLKKAKESPQGTAPPTLKKE
jgi:glycosyltransferase involved in cell wall biosynthesis